MQSAVFALLSLTVYLCLVVWNVLPRAIRRELEDVAKYLHEPELLAPYRQTTMTTLGHLTRVYWALYVLCMAFFMTATFMGPPAFLGLTVSMATFLYRVVMLPLEGLVILFTLVNLPPAIPPDARNIQWNSRRIPVPMYSGGG